MAKTLRRALTLVALPVVIGLVGPVPSASAKDHQIGFGVMTSSSGSGGSGGYHGETDGTGKFKHIGKGTWHSEAGAGSCEFGACDAWAEFTFVAKDGGTLTGSAGVEGTSQVPDVIDLVGTGSLAGWTGHISLRSGPTGSDYIFVGEIDRPGRRPGH